MKESLTEKKQALEILIRQSILIEIDRKQELINKISTMNEESINALGKFLAQEVKTAHKFYQKNMSKIDNLIKQIDTIKN